MMRGNHSRKSLTTRIEAVEKEIIGKVLKAGKRQQKPDRQET